MTGIYLITCGGLAYVGQSKNIERRLNQHRLLIRNNRHPNFDGKGSRFLHNYKFSILEYCSIIDLNERERYHFNKLQKRKGVTLVNKNRITSSNVSPKQTYHLSISEANKRSIDTLCELHKASADKLLEAYFSLAIVDFEDDRESIKAHRAYKLPTCKSEMRKIKRYYCKYKYNNRDCATLLDVTLKEAAEIRKALRREGYL